MVALYSVVGRISFDRYGATRMSLSQVSDIRGGCHYIVGGVVRLESSGEIM